MKYNANASSCETFSYGEVEDYTVNVSSSGRVENQSLITDFTIFPNPAVSQTTLRFNSEKTMNVKINVYDAVGRQVQFISLENVIGTHDETLEVSELKPGIYHIFVEANGKRESYKLVKK